jgi:hypothetical protein
MSSFCGRGKRDQLLMTDGSAATLRGTGRDKDDLRGGVEEFVAVDFGGNAGLAVLRGLGADDLAVAADIDIAGASDLFGQRDDKLDCGADFGFGFGEEVETAIADVAGEGFEFVRIRTERENSHRQRHVEAARFAAICDGHTAPSG